MAPALAIAAAIGGCSSGRPARPAPVTGPVTQISRGSCAHGNAEVELASDPAHDYVYAEWIGCHEIGFAASADGGRTWSRPVALPGSAGASWDPAIAVGPSGTVYAAFMVFGVAPDPRGYYPVVDISASHGRSFRTSRLGAPSPRDFGDRDFVAAGPHGQIYVTWDYAPVRGDVKIACFHGGSCAYTNGDLNAVLQASSDGGRTWSQIRPIAPGFPDSGSISAPVIVQPSGRIDVLFERFSVRSSTLAIGAGHDYFTSSADGGGTWTGPVRLGPRGQTISRNQWWIDGSLAADGGGNLYATWDTRSGASDTGWLEYSQTSGRTWSRPVRVASSQGAAANIVQVLGGAAGTAYVGVLANGRGRGFAQYLRAFSIGAGWRTGVVKVSRADALASVWPGDTIGLALLAGVAGNRRVAVSWGGATTDGQSQIRAAVVSRLP